MNDIKVGDPVELDKPKRWLGPVLFLVIVVTPILILVFSNTASATFHFAGFEWRAPLWMVLAVMFVAGAIGTRLLGVVWRLYRKHRRQLQEGTASGR
jgi:uncharacterized integral membrane protein